MRKDRVLLTVLLLSILAPHSYAGTNIDILLTFSDDTNMSVAEKTQLALEVQTNLGFVYGMSIAGLTLPSQLLNDQTVTVHSLLIDLSYEAANRSIGDALTWMKDENLKRLPPSPLRFARDNVPGTPGADIVLMVVPGTTSNKCGAARGIPLFATELYRELYAFGVIVPEDLDTDCNDDIDFAHEVGHVLYSEHEVDTNFNIVAPDHRNHAIQSSQSNLKSLMWDGLEVDNSNSRFLSGHLGQMTASDNNNVEFFSDTSFDIVSNYRKPPPPEEEYEIFFTMTCDGTFSIVLGWAAVLNSNALSVRPRFQIQFCWSTPLPPIPPGE